MILPLPAFGVIRQLDSPVSVNLLTVALYRDMQDYCGRLSVIGAQPGLGNLMITWSAPSV